MIIKHKNAEIVNQTFFKNDKTKEEYATIAYRLDEVDLTGQVYPKLPHIFTKTVNNVISKDDLKNIIQFITPRTTRSFFRSSVSIISSKDTHFKGNLNNVDDLTDFIKASKRVANYRLFLQALEKNDKFFKSQYNIKFSWFGFRELNVIYNNSENFLSLDDLKMIKKLLKKQNNFNLVEVINI